MIRFSPLVLLALVLCGPVLAQTTCTIKDGNGTLQTIRCPNPDGRAAAAQSAPMVMSTEDKAVVDAVAAAVGVKVDAKSTATDATPASQIALLKGIIDRLQAVLNALPATNADGGAQAHTQNGALESGGNLAAAAAAAGAKADAKSTATDTTPASEIALLKGQIDRLQAILALMPTPVGGRTPTLPVAATDITTSYTVDATNTGTTLATVVPNGMAGLGIDVGTISGGAVLQPQSQSTVGGPWANVSVIAAGGVNSGLRQATITAAGSFSTDVAAKAGFRLIPTTAGTGTIPVTFELSALANIVGVTCTDANRCLGTSFGRDATGAAHALLTDTTGALAPPVAPSTAITETVVALTASTSTQLVALDATRIAVELQCDGTAPIGISLKGTTLTGLAAAPKVLPATAYQVYTPPVAPQSAITAWTATAQTCRVTSYAAR